MFGQQTGIDLSYSKILVPDHQFVETAEAFLKTGLGFNVTLPCKHDAFNFAQEHGEDAIKAQAVNTISLTAGGVIRGDNTDGRGLVTDLKENLGWTLAGKKMLVLGAGGAVSGVLPALTRERPSMLHIYNRTMSKAEQLASRLDSVEAVAADQLCRDYDVVINGTSMGITGGGDQLPVGIIQEDCLCYDMVYGPETTVFNQWCLDQARCITADGLGMLVEQAALSFRIWFERVVETAEVIETLRSSLR